jgi:hypothetical protein
MLSITVNPESLTPAQRKFIADIIVNFPASDDDQSEIPKFPAFAGYEDPEESASEESPEVAFASTNVVTMQPPAPATPAGVSLDKDGLPWDARIHTSSKATNADGSWRRKRGVNEAEVTHVEGELRQLMGITPAPLPSPTPIAAVPPPPPPPAPTPIAAVAPPADPYIALISRASELIGAKLITKAQLDAAIIDAGGVSLALMNSRPDLIPQVLASINALVPAV